MAAETPGTESIEYRDRLVRLQTARWKRWLHVQAPYRWHIRRMATGTTLKVGRGIGRNLAYLRGNAVGIDHNPACVEEARRQGLPALTPKEFRRAVRQEQFDNLLFSHVLEHMTLEQARNLVIEYAPRLASGGRVIVITPQELGQGSDPAHVTFLDFGKLAALAATTGFRAERAYSFPFPRSVGKWFRYNEFVSIWRRP